MQNKKVVFTNELDISVLDADFYLKLLKNIKQIQESNNEKIANCNPDMCLS